MLKQGIVLLLALLLALLAGKPKLLDHLDYAFYDHLLFSVDHAPPPQRVTVIGIDQASLDRFPEPLVLWHSYLAGAIAAAAAGEARAVGLDLIPSISLQTLAPELDTALFKALRQAGAAGAPIILGYDAGADGMLPHRKFAFAASGLGYLNMWPDRDGVVRRYRARIQSGERQNNSLGLATLLAGLDNPPPAVPEHLFVNYRGAPPPVLSLAEVYDRLQQDDTAWLRQQLAGRLVLIGVTALKLHDNHAVPGLPAAPHTQHIPGVLIHGLAMDTLLSERRLQQPAEDLVRFGLALPLALFSGGLFLLLNPIRASLILAAGLILGYFGLRLAFAASWWIPPAGLLSALLAPALFCGLYRYIVQFRQFRHLQHYFQSYVSAEALQAIIEHPADIGFSGRQVEVTVMFADIRNFTSLAEKLPPAAVVSGLNRYFTEMTHAITASGGYLNRYLGDGLLAFFGHPRPLARNGALAAVRSAREMCRRLEQLNHSQLFPAVERIDIGIGLHTGEAIVGNIGCEEKMDYSIIGDTVNLASRIEGETKTYRVRILISETTYNLVKDQVQARRVAATQVKGREQTVELFELIRLNDEQPTQEAAS